APGDENPPRGVARGRPGPGPERPALDVALAAPRGEDVVLGLRAREDVRLALDEEGPAPEALLAEPVELVGVRGVLAADHERRVEGLRERPRERVLVHLRGVAEGVVAALPADAGRRARGVVPELLPEDVPQVRDDLARLVHEERRLVHDRDPLEVAVHVEARRELPGEERLQAAALGRVAAEDDLPELPRLLDVPDDDRGRVPAGVGEGGLGLLVLVLAVD